MLDYLLFPGATWLGFAATLFMTGLLTWHRFPQMSVVFSLFGSILVWGFGYGSIDLHLVERIKSPYGWIGPGTFFIGGLLFIWTMVSAGRRKRAVGEIADQKLSASIPASDLVGEVLRLRAGIRIHLDRKSGPPWERDRLLRELLPEGEQLAEQAEDSPAIQI